MGNCPCWPKKSSNYDPYIDDEEYMEYDSPSSRNAPHRYRTLAPDPEPTSRQTSTPSHKNRPPDDEHSTYVPPPLPISHPTPTQEAQRRLSWTSSSPPTSASPSNNQNNHNNNSNSSNNNNSSSNNNSSTQARQQYTQYSESAYLSRIPDQPTDSMLLDSMMKSSFLNHPQHLSSSSSSPSSPSPSSSFSSSSQYHQESSLIDSNLEMERSVRVPNPDMENSQATYMEGSASTSSSSSIYYDAAAVASSYLMGSVNEGAFENPSEPRL